MSTETSAVKQFWLKNKAIFPVSGIISVNVLTFSLKPCGFVVVFFLDRHADVMKKIIQTVADGGGELGVHMYPLSLNCRLLSDF